MNWITTFQIPVAAERLGPSLFFEQTQLCSDGPDTNKLGSRLYTDTQVSWTPAALQGGAWTFTLGINNLFNEKPAICFSCDLNSLDVIVYPIAGQFWYVRAIVEM